MTPATAHPDADTEDAVTAPMPLSATAPPDGPALIEAMLSAQREPTAVERFARAHDQGDVPTQEQYYRDLIPLSTPREGEQYAFEVDLDACTGCKACVAACHSLNGLDDKEAFRDVGLLHGGTVELPVLQTVTTACHHCLEPACMDGCPVKAYVKDEVTGIVKHLDDQCIGCQYCVLKCPYDVPKYNADKGIVRKCDMCSDRLAVGEAPACVQACPNQAIRITVVNKHQVVEDCETSAFLPGAPDPDYTLPTTQYRTGRTFPRNLRPADYYNIAPEHAHFPLVLMLVLTQMSVGAFAVAQILEAIVGRAMIDPIRPIHAIGALGLGLVALGASTMHLGRPLYAFRAVIGLRTSWLSREILAFGGFAKLAMAYAAVNWLWPDAAMIQRMLGISVVVTGLIGVACSALIYHDTRRVFWDISRTGHKFLLSGLITGLSTMLAATLITGAILEKPSITDVMNSWGSTLCLWLMIAAGLKMLFETSVFAHLKDVRHTPMKRTAMLMCGALAHVTLKRYAFGILGGLVVPGVMLAAHHLSDSGITPLLAASLATLTVALNLLGELSERYLFFTAVVSPKMPGGVM